jgi:hypothetical protein
LNVLCLPAFGAFDNVELYALAFLERTETVALDCGVMDEYVVSAAAADEAESFCVVKPLYGSLFHCRFLLDDVEFLPLNSNLELIASRARAELARRPDWNIEYQYNSIVENLVHF